jgi:hypothetical protein
VRAWTALRAASVESRFEAMHATGLTDLVGREEELDLLLRRWSKAKTDGGQVVLLSGEARIIVAHGHACSVQTLWHAARPPFLSRPGSQCCWRATHSDQSASFQEKPVEALVVAIKTTHGGDHHLAET